MGLVFKDFTPELEYYVHSHQCLILLLRQFMRSFVFQTKRLFGHPNLIIVPTNILGKDVHSFIARLLPEPVSSLPFTLHLVDQQVSIE